MRHVAFEGALCPEAASPDVVGSYGFHPERELPDMMSASEGGGGHGKADIVRQVSYILQYESDPNADKGGVCEKSKKDVISGCSQISIWK